MERKNAWLKYQDDKKKVVFDFANNYVKFLSKCKTERECVKEIREIAKSKGYKDLNTLKELKPGDKVYVTNYEKNIMLFNIGVDDITEGINILGSHIDSPRMDLKQNPLYEDEELALLDTHYYGGIKKYQWVTIPLALHGVVVTKDNKKIDIVIGEDDEDVCVGITDLLIHLSQEQLAKKGNKVVEGEDLNVLVGSIPLKKEDETSTKEMILKLLDKKYGITEEDFISSEIEVVPAGKARHFGLDNSMVLGYGHDDRVCAYASAFAQFELESVKRTVCTLLVDKEEIGSVGATGAMSRFFENTISDVVEMLGHNNSKAVRDTLKNSCMLSSDVSAAYDPNYPSVFEKKNSAFLGKGLVFNKYTGARGKSGSNDCSAEYMGMVRNIMNKNDIAWQTAELGKVDAGGGGTIAYLTANLGMNVVDSGVPVLSMHAPNEIISKVDLYEAKEGYVAFAKNAKKLSY